MPYDPVASRADAEALARAREPFQPPEVIQPRRPQPYQSPPRLNEGHAAKKKSGLDLTPNSSRLNSSLKELSLEKKRARAGDDGGSQHTAATKKKLFPRPTQAVPPQQTVAGVLPKHQKLLDDNQ